MIYHGGCHCGAVRFEVIAPEQFHLTDCNCSICAKSGYLHLLVEKDKFTLLQGRDQLVEYRFNTGVARHLFCRVCGIKSFYVPRSHPQGISVNGRCLDSLPDTVLVKRFDGRHWEENIEALHQ